MTLPLPPLGLLTVEQCAELLQCSADQIEKFIKAGELRRVSLSIRQPGKGPRGRKCWRVTPTALREFVMLREGYEPQPAEKPSTLDAIPQSAYPPRRALGPDGKLHACGTDGKIRRRFPRQK